MCEIILFILDQRKKTEQYKKDKERSFQRGSEAQGNSLSAKESTTKLRKVSMSLLFCVFKKLEQYNKKIEQYKTQLSR
jgi:hypothetical protein